MLSIYIHSGADPGFLDLPPDAVLDIESYTDAFQQEENASEFTLPLEILWTDNNRRRLGFRERIENFNKTGNYFTCTVYNHNFPELVNAKLTILGKAGNFQYRQGRFSITIAGTRGIFASNIKNKNLQDFALGGEIGSNLYGNWRDFAYAHQTTNYASYPQLRFVPVAMELFFDQQRSDFNGEFIARDTVNNVVQLTGGGWVFGRPSATDIHAAVSEADLSYVDYRTVPFFTVKHILKSIFIEAGFTVTGEFLTNTDFDNLVIFNNYSLEIYKRNFLEVTDVFRSIDPRNHVPKMPVKDFIDAICKGLGIFPVFTDATNVVLVNYNTSIDTAQTISIDAICADTFTAEYADGTATANGYKINYATDSADQFFGERVKDISQFKLVATVDTVANLATIPRSGLTTNDIAYCQADNLYYQVANATVVPVLWEPVAEGLFEFKTGNGERSVDIPFGTLATYVVFNETTSLFEKRNYLGTRQPGSYSTAKGDIVKNPFSLRLFYASPPGLAIPASYNHNKNSANVSIEKYSLSLTAKDGLKALLQPWQNILQNSETIKTSVVANAANLELLRNYRKLQQAGTVFMLKKVERTIPMSASIKIELVPL